MFKSQSNWVCHYSNCMSFVWLLKFKFHPKFSSLNLRKKPQNLSSHWKAIFEMSWDSVYFLFYFIDLRALGVFMLSADFVYRQLTEIAWCMQHIPMCSAHTGMTEQLVQGLYWNQVKSFFTSGETLHTLGLTPILSFPSILSREKEHSVYEVTFSLLVILFSLFFFLS